MSSPPYLHELPDFDVLIERVQREHKNVLPQVGSEIYANKNPAPPA